MAYPAEHSARQESPDKYVTHRRVNDDLGPGRDVVYGIRPSSGPQGGFTEIQSIRFDARIHSADDAKEWLKENDFDTSRFIAAVGRPNPSRGEMYSGMLDAAQRLARREDVDPALSARMNAYASELQRRRDQELDPDQERQNAPLFAGLTGRGLLLPPIHVKSRGGVDSIMRYVVAAGLGLVVTNAMGEIDGLNELEIPEFLRNAM